jgi:cellulose synthase/poly-beta-1,6-N-acetylglucosamine synthase-like glycosyltransferase
MQPVNKIAKKNTEVSVILLCYNQRERIRGKIQALLKELTHFRNFELIVLDDCSTEQIPGILQEYIHHPNVKIILKKEQRGIPHSMNLGVRLAQYNRVVFSDVRQQLSSQVIQQLVAPLEDPEIGAVSSCLAARTGKRSYSILRWYENILKKLESRTGNLIGVYGPLYAIRKDCYREMPNHIILDDLYNGLRILGSKKVIMVECCRIFDEDFSTLYDYHRSKRYLLGFLQILQEGFLFRKLSTRHRIMLFWHKYIRLLFPVLLFLFYIFTGIEAFIQPYYLLLFGFLTFAGLFSVWPSLHRNPFRIRDILRINVYYLVAIFDILIHRSFLKHETYNSPQKI